MMNYDTLVVITPQDFIRLQNQYERLISNLQMGKVIFVGTEGVYEAMKACGIDKRADFINEDSIIPFADVHNVIEKHMQPILGGKSLPRGITGWYYQQFLKMQYAYICENEYYMTWDGDTIPTKPVNMFKEDTDIPYMDLKVEMHQEYFDTMSVLVPGLRKCIAKSFISEHMLFNVKLMKQLIDKIMSNVALEGDTFYEKVIHAIAPDKIQDSSFSEFETYGTFVCFNAPDVYKLRDWHSFRLAGEFFDPVTITDRDYKWLSQDFGAISFEKGQTVREDHKHLFDNPEYQLKATPRQMLQEAQKEFQDGYMEVWEQDSNIVKAPDEFAFMYFNNLGDYYENINVDKAFLCYEQAYFICKDDNYKQAIQNKMLVLKKTKNINVKKAAIVIVSFNCMYMMQKCIESIRKTTAPEMRDIIVVDNGSTDGVVNYLEEQEDLLLIKNDKNEGFPRGCNIGIEKTEEQDIFLLNNDTRLTENALFWLRMGLYENASIGATGAVANYCCEDQLRDVIFKTVNEYEAYGADNNKGMGNPYEEKSRLSGFAMLIKREAFDKIGKLDEAFSPGYFEDDDISTGIHSLGYKLLVCHNAFIYHAGSQSFVKRDDLQEIMARNLTYIKNKWGYDIFAAALVSESEANAMKKINHGKDDSFRILEVGCGSGNLLTRIKQAYPNASVYGVDKEEGAVWNAVTSVPVMLWNSPDNLPFPGGFFDYIIYNDRYENGPDKNLIMPMLTGYLNFEGQLIFC